MRRGLQFSTLVLLSLALLAALPATAAPASPVADVLLGAGQVEWVPAQEFAGLKLTVSGPEGVTEHVFGPGESPRFELASLAGSIDGLYTWELTASPVVDANVRSVLAQSRVEDAGDGARSRPAGLPPRDSLIQSGSFRVVDGAIVQPADENPAATPSDQQVRRIVAADQVIPDDLIVQQSLCVGFDCVNNEDFGFDTIRLKENNLRIHFLDTSAGSFPSNDWRLVANDSASGGRSVFYLEDSTAGREVLSVVAGAPTNSLWISATTGNVGFGTSTPVLQLHVKDGNTPGLRLEQDTSSGFSAQTWDVAGNEANFFVRSASTGSQLPFRIRPGAPTSSIDIAATGNVGIGTASPAEKIHVSATDNPRVLIADTTDNANDKPGFVLRSPAADSAGDWNFEVDNAGNFQIDFGPSSGAELLIADNPTGNGTVTIFGDLMVNGTCTGCDAVFQPGFPLESIDEHAASMWEQSYLPAVGPTPEGQTHLNVFAKTTGILQELEKAHIYIEQLHQRLSALEQELAAEDAQE